MPGAENQMFESLLWSDPRPSSNFPEVFHFFIDSHLMDVIQVTEELVSNMGQTLPTHFVVKTE